MVVQKLLLILIANLKNEIVMIVFYVTDNKLKHVYLINKKQKSKTVKEISYVNFEGLNKGGLEELRELKA